MSNGMRRAVFAAGLLVAGVAAPAASRALYAQTTCYFKDCLVYPDGSRLCSVKQVPCPAAE
jgi:hypothetical protein